MAPTYTMSAHLCKEIYKSWQTRHTSPEPLGRTTSPYPAFPQRSPSPDIKRSMDSDRDSHHSGSSTPPLSSSPPASWKWGGRQ